MWVESIEATSNTEGPRLAACFLDVLASGSCLELLPIAAYFCDREGNLIQANTRANSLWGRAPSDDHSFRKFCGSHQLLHADNTPMAHEHSPMADVLRTGIGIRDHRICIEKPDGSRIAVLLNIEPVLDEDGNLRGAISCMQDITELRHALEAAEVSERKLHTVLNALPEAIYTTDASGRITFYNKASVAMVGREPRSGSDAWCISWKLRDRDGKPLPLEECAMAMALREKRAVAGAEAIAERPDGRHVPFLAYPTPLFDAAGDLMGAVNMLVDISERKRASEAQKLLIDELNHRVKNTLATVQSIADQSAKSAKSPADFVAKFSGRLQSLAHVHTILTETTWCGADLDELVRGQVLLDAADEQRVQISGPGLMLAAQPALYLALVLHELGTNARLHGALSVPGGRLSVTWRVEDGEVVLQWQEAGGPQIIEAGKRGFGLKLIERSLLAYGGQVMMSFAAGGVSCNIRLPLAASVDDGRKKDPGRKKESGPDDEDADRGEVARTGVNRVLVVEDEPFVAMDIETCLLQAGFDVVGPAANAERAMELIEEGRFDVALMDANLAGKRVDGLAEALKLRGVPFAFVSGYGRDGLPEGFRDRLLVSKPFSDQQLIGAVSVLSEQRASQGQA